MQQLEKKKRSYPKILQILNSRTIRKVHPRSNSLIIRLPSLSNRTNCVKILSLERKLNGGPWNCLNKMRNVAAVNGYDIYLLIFYQNKDWSELFKEIPLSRFNFVKLTKQMSKPWLKHRLALKIPQELQMPKPGNFYLCNRTFCNYEKKRKTATNCSKCNKPICGGHTKIICNVALLLQWEIILYDFLKFVLVLFTFPFTLLDVY